MKVKLKISKQLKRALKFKADELEKDRIQYVQEAICAYLEQKGCLSETEIQSLQEELTKKVADLEAFVTATVSNENLEDHEKTNLIKQYKYENQIFDTHYSPNKRMENLIIDIEDPYYHTLVKMATERQKGLENLIEQMIHHYK